MTDAAVDQASLIRPLTLVAFGGNALLESSDVGTIEEQLRRAELAAEWLVDLVELGRDLVIVHGNGPQVGQVLIQMEEAATKVPPATLDVAVAQTEGGMGYLLEMAIRNRLQATSREAEVATLLSMVVVDTEDPAFHQPTKPIGPFFSKYRASILRRELGWSMVEDSGRGWRKVVSSPRPIEVLGMDGIRNLLAVGTVVIAGGGGGIPVIRRPGGQVEGVEAVIDKDRTAALMGTELKADLLVNLTNVPHVSRNFGKRNEKRIDRLSAGSARRMVEKGRFPPGSMGPKIEATAGFVEATGNSAIITNLDQLGAALAGDAGTRIIP